MKALITDHKMTIKISNSNNLIRKPYLLVENACGDTLVFPKKEGDIGDLEVIVEHEDMFAGTQEEWQQSIARRVLTTLGIEA